MSVHEKKSDFNLSVAIERSKDAFYFSFFKYHYNEMYIYMRPRKIVKKIKEAGLGDIDLDKIPTDDKATFELFQCGDTEEIDPFCTSRLMLLMQKMKPDHFEDLTALLYLENNFIIESAIGSGIEPCIADRYIERKHGMSPFEYDLPILKDILGETYGMIFYWEQVMQIAMSLAGFSPEEANILRKTFLKVRADKIEAQRRLFILGAAQNDISEKLSGKIYDEIKLYWWQYCLKKYYVVECALLGYRMAWLKVHYPREFDSGLHSF